MNNLITKFLSSFSTQFARINFFHVNNVKGYIAAIKNTGLWLK